MKRLRAIFALFVLGAAPRSPASGLAWERESASVAVGSGQGVVRVSYPFQNAGDRAVTVVSIETSCRCLAAEIKKLRYAPGEKGELTVAFSVGNQKGILEKSVTVATDDPGDKAVRLVLHVDIPESPGATR